MKTAEMNALKCLVFPVFFFPPMDIWKKGSSYNKRGGGGALFETQEQSVREGGFKTMTRVSGIKVYFKSSSLLTPTPGSGPITRHPHPHGLSLALTWKHEQREMSQVS